VCRGCSVERNSGRDEGRWGGRRRIMTKRGVREARERVVLDGKTEECGARRSTASVGVGEDGFMPQR
jgi:hypothetical protein